jgi:predicted  nucleic acid-binding Zn-ribbon protein
MEMSSFKARLVVDDIERVVGEKVSFLRHFVGEMDAIDAAIADKKRELADLHPQVKAKQQELEELYKEIKRVKGILDEERQARKDWVA